MKRARNRWLQLLRAASLVTLGGVWAVACAGPQEPGAAGSVCFRTDDCKDGLACVPTAKGSSKSTCSADLTLIVSMVDGAPPDSATPTGDAAAETGGGAGGTGGTPLAAGGAVGKPATGGATSPAGSAAGGKASGGAGAGAPAGGAATAAAGTAGAGTAGSSSGGGTAGSQPVDAGDG